MKNTARIAALVMATPAAAFTPPVPALHSVGYPAVRALCGTPAVSSSCSVRPVVAASSKLTLSLSGTPMDQAKALPPLDLTEENVEKALEEAKDVLGARVFGSTCLLRACISTSDLAYAYMK